MVASDILSKEGGWTYVRAWENQSVYLTFFSKWPFCAHFYPDNA